MSSSHERPRPQFGKDMIQADVGPAPPPHEHPHKLVTIEQELEQEERRETFLSEAREGQPPVNSLQVARQWIYDLEADLKRTRDALAREEERTREIRKEWNKQVTELMKLQTERIYKLDDDYIESEWIKLDYKIKDWAARHFPSSKAPKFRKIPSMLLRTCVDFDRCWGYDCLRPHIVRAALWEEIKFWIFSDEALRQEDAHEEAFYTLKRAIYPDIGSDGDIKIRDYHTWRSITSTLLTASTDANPRRKAIQKVKQDAVRDLAPYSPTLKPDLDGELESIFIDALELNSDLRQQRADYFVMSPSLMRRSSAVYGFPFNAAHMDSVEGLGSEHTGKTTVAISLRPVLLKAGTSDGDNYDTVTTVSNSEVICSGHWKDLIRQEDEVRRRHNEAQRQGHAVQKKQRGLFPASAGH